MITWMRMATAAVLGLTVFGGTRPALGVVVNRPEYEDVSGTVTGPNPAWFGRWGDNASAVAVGPNLVLSTRHQGGASTVNFGGTNYNVLSIVNLGGAGVDLQLATIDGNLGSNFATPYTGAVDGKTAVFGGFGAQLGESDRYDSTTPPKNLIGYSTTPPSIAGPGPFNANTLLLGQNRVDSGGATSSFVNFPNTTVFLADFDGPDQVPFGATGISPMPIDKVYMEASPGVGDSGGGWFINDGGVWRLAGLSAAAPVDEAFTEIEFGGIEVVDIRQYAGQVPEPATLSVLTIGAFALLRRDRGFLSRG